MSSVFRQYILGLYTMFLDPILVIVLADCLLAGLPGGTASHLYSHGPYFCLSDEFESSREIRTAASQ
jgi:hypothetical protein